VTEKAADALVVGAGVIGLSLAWRAAHHGLRVQVFDKGKPGAGTTHVAAGMLAPVSEAEAGEPELLELMRRSAAMYPAFVAALQEESGVDPGYRRCGTLAVARDRDELEALAREHALRESLQLRTNRLLPSAARELEPALAPAIRGALDVPDDHAVDPRALIRALVTAAERAGVEIRKGVEVEACVQQRGRIEGVRLRDGSIVRAGAVVVAAGVWSHELAGAPVHPVKGQTLRLRDPRGGGLLDRVIRMASAYIVPRGDGRYVLGATLEERGYDTTATAGAAYELLRDAIEIIPGVSEMVIEELAVGLRPATRDGRPLIGAAGVPGLHWATGHYRHGVLLAPVTAELALAALTDQRAAA
jgi:glycine oxidase